jgi:TIR domain
VPPTGYRHDVFLSYSRMESWPRWVDNCLLDVLRHWLGVELARPVTIFRDVKNIQPGQHWPKEVEIGLAESRIMIALWCRSYFESEWCRRELSAMLARAYDFRERGLGDQIIWPLVIHDSYRIGLPDVVRDMQVETIDDYAEPFMHPQSPLRERLSQAMKHVCKQLARQIEGVRDDSFAWPLADYSTFLAKLDPPRRGKVSLPSLGTPE